MTSTSGEPAVMGPSSVDATTGARAGPALNQKTSHPRTYDEWLDSTFVSNENITMYVRQYFNTTVSEDSTKAYWTDEHFGWALEFLRRKYRKHKDILIGTTWTSQCLHIAYRHSAGLYTDELEATVFPTNAPAPKRVIPTLQEEYKDELDLLQSYNIIILPVNNGLGDGGADVALGNGSHWSLIVINKEARTARYLDSLVLPELVATPAQNSGKRRWKSTNTKICSETAGQILCGFETLLQIEPRGKYRTSTLKWIPHQFRHNNARKRDHGPCGPHMFAILDYLLQNRKLIDDGLENSFAKREFRKRRDEMNYNSITSRKKLKRLLWAERRRLESDPGTTLTHFANFTTEFLQNTMDQDTLDAIADVLEKRKQDDNDDDHDDDNDDDNDDDHEDDNDDDNGNGNGNGNANGNANGNGNGNENDHENESEVEDEPNPLPSGIGGIRPNLFISLDKKLLDMWIEAHDDLDPGLHPAADLQRRYGLQFAQFNKGQTSLWFKHDEIAFPGPVKDTLGTDWKLWRKHLETTCPPRPTIGESKYPNEGRYRALWSTIHEHDPGEESEEDQLAFLD